MQYSQGNIRYLNGDIVVTKYRTRCWYFVNLCTVVWKWNKSWSAGIGNRRIETRRCFRPARTVKPLNYWVDVVTVFLRTGLLYEHCRPVVIRCNWLVVCRSAWSCPDVCQYMMVMMINDLLLVIWEYLLIILAVRCNCIAKFGYCHVPYHHYQWVQATGHIRR